MRLTNRSAHLPIEMVFIPAGEFIRGSDPGEGDRDEIPKRPIGISDFYISRTEITNEQFAETLNWALLNGYAVRDSGEVRPTGGNYYTRSFLEMGSRLQWDGDQYQVKHGYQAHPVVRVTAYGARLWCVWRSQMEGLDPAAEGYRLPTEAEWEKAARGGLTLADGDSNPLPERTFPWGDEPPDCARANYGSCSTDTAPVGSRSEGASPYGVADMAGNVWEWCRDPYDANYYEDAPSQDPRGPSRIVSPVVVRGGSWGDSPDFLRVANRSFDVQSYGIPQIGFRVARTP